MFWNVIYYFDTDITIILNSDYIIENKHIIKLQ